MKGLARYWGYMAFVLLIVAWLSRDYGPEVLLILSALVTLYFLFQAPLWCGAETREHLRCRNNSMGLLLGCHLREHRWQRLKTAVVSRRWREFNRQLWTTPRDSLATLATLVGIVSGIAATITAVLANN